MFRRKNKIKLDLRKSAEKQTELKSTLNNNQTKNNQNNTGATAEKVLPQFPPNPTTSPNKEEKNSNPEKKKFSFSNFFKPKPKKTENLDQTLSRTLKGLGDLQKKKLIVKKKNKIFSIRGFEKIVNLSASMEKAGLDPDYRKITKEIFIFAGLITVLASIIFLLTGIVDKTAGQIFLFLLTFGVTCYALMLAVLWILYLFYIDLMIFHRTRAVEAVFPDFLQLASSNISAGMPVDQALWYAVRPNFGILAKEIEIVAKNVMAGEGLPDALTKLANRYDSKVIKRSISLILEGLSSGGEMADLLNKIALDIEETKILERDMAANVTTYVIFISFASIIAAPILFGLSTELLNIIREISANLGEAGTASTGFSSFSVGPGAIKVADFKIFSYTMLIISSFFSACIVAVIQKGRVKENISKIPIFIAVSLVLYTLATYFMRLLFAGIISF